MVLRFSGDSNPRLNEVKPPADVTDFLKVVYRASSIKIRTQIRRANLIEIALMIKGSELLKLHLSY